MTVLDFDEGTALILIDLQNALAAAPTTPSTPAQVATRAAALAQAFRDRHLPVILVRVSLAADASDAAPGRTQTGRGPRKMPPGWDQVVDELAGHPSDITVTKHGWDAFHATDLDLQLRRRHITHVVLGGLVTSGSVESTARSAYDTGYHVILATDVMADLDADAHEHTVTRIFPRLGRAATTHQLMTALENIPR